MQTNRLLFILGGLALLYIVLGVLGPIPLSPAFSPPFGELVRFSALVLFVVVGVVSLSLKMSKTRSGGKGIPANQAAEQILRERYARGEMDRAQFGQMLNDLRSDLSPNL
jgi:uncharacterized membrane protein